MGLRETLRQKQVDLLLQERYGQGDWFTRHGPRSVPVDQMPSPAALDDSPESVALRREAAVAEGFPRQKKATWRRRS